MKAGGCSKRWALAVALVLALVWWRYVDWLREAPHFQDLNVYRAGARALLDGSALYADRSAGHGQLVFTYPPFAALIFVPFALLPWAGAAVVLVLLSALGYAVLIGVFGRSLGWTRTGIAVAAGVGLLAEPVLRTIQQGQVNLVLAALVSADLLIVPRRYRGILIGIAAGIKLVPAAFGLCLLARRDLGSILRLIATTVGTVWPSLLAPSWRHRSRGRTTGSGASRSA